MVAINHIPPKPMEASVADHDHDDESTIFSATTPAETIINGIFETEDPLSGAAAPRIQSAVPWPGRTFIIRCSSTGKVLTLLNGRVDLASPTSPMSTLGSDHWTCVETKGWLGFRNPISGRLLGHDAAGNLINRAGNHLPWEFFAVRPTPEGGYLLLLTHWERLWQVGFKTNEGKLAKMETNGIVWEFVEVSG